jgi:predicted ArsR family transcriptional regulator
VSLPTDLELNQIGVLRRRAIEARILAPVVAAMAKEFGAERVHTILRQAIEEIARRQGAALASAARGNGLAEFHDTLDRWTTDDALQLEVLAREDDRLAFNVTRCRYAEMYRELGIPELGAILSCSRDAALIEGFNPAVRFTRTQTILGGATHCDFRYHLTRPDDSSPE